MNRAVEELSLANDFIFGEVMRQPENVKPLLEAVLEKKIAEITYIEKQQDIKDGYELHGIRLDISLEDNEKTQYAVEMQTGSAFDLERRIRYYQSSLDRRTLEVSEHYRDLKSSYVIFICTEDYYKRGLALYKRRSVIEGAEDIVYEDGSHAYILNAKFTEPNLSKPALEFLRYINAKNHKLPYDVSGSEYLTKIDQAVEDIKADDRKVEIYDTGGEVRGCAVYYSKRSIGRRPGGGPGRRGTQRQGGFGQTAVGTGNVSGRYCGCLRSGFG